MTSPISDDPVFFQETKHHLAACLAWLLEAAGRREDPEAVASTLAPIGLGGVADVYDGDLSVGAIRLEIGRFLEARGIASAEAYHEFLRAEGQRQRLGYYALMDLTDGSRFCLRQIADPARFVHAHPARGSPGTFRVRPSTLKTALVAFYLERLGRGRAREAGVLGQARGILLLPPFPGVPEAIDRVLARIEARSRS